MQALFEIPPEPENQAIADKKADLQPNHIGFDMHIVADKQVGWSTLGGVCFTIAQNDPSIQKTGKNFPSESGFQLIRLIIILVKNHYHHAKSKPMFGAEMQANRN